MVPAPDNYGSRPEVQIFIGEMVAQHGFDAAALPVDVLIREAHDLDDAQPLDAHEVDDEEVAEAAREPGLGF